MARVCRFPRARAIRHISRDALTEARRLNNALRETLERLAPRTLRAEQNALMLADVTRADAAYFYLRLGNGTKAKPDVAPRHPRHIWGCNNSEDAERCLCLAKLLLASLVLPR